MKDNPPKRWPALLTSQLWLLGPYPGNTNITFALTFELEANPDLHQGPLHGATPEEDLVCEAQKCSEGYRGSTLCIRRPVIIIMSELHSYNGRPLVEPPSYWGQEVARSPLSTLCIHLLTQNTHNFDLPPVLAFIIQI